MDSHTVPCHPKPNSNFIKPAGKVAKMVADMTVEKNWHVLNKVYWDEFV